jgi:SAM-dependent methyltransferase
MFTQILRWLKGSPFEDPWKVSQYEQLAHRVIPHLKDARRVLDMGCGEGLFSSLIRQGIPDTELLVGMDLAEEANWASPPCQMDYVVGDASSPPFGSRSLDVVVAKDLLHHMDDAKAGIAAIVRLARLRVVIVEANLDNPIMAFYTRHNGDWHLSTSVLKKLLSEVAPDLEWELEVATAYPFYLPPVRNISALWVWPLTALMLLAFKLGHSQRLAVALGNLLNRPRWAPPFNVAVATIHAGVT